MPVKINFSAIILIMNFISSNLISRMMIRIILFFYLCANSLKRIWYLNDESQLEWSFQFIFVNFKNSKYSILSKTVNLFKSSDDGNRVLIKKKKKRNFKWKREKLIDPFLVFQSISRAFGRNSIYASRWPCSNLIK